MVKDINQDIRPKTNREGKKILIFVILFVVLLGASYFISKAEKGAGAAEVDFDLYVMSQCPYGTQAEAAMMEAMVGFEDYVNFNVEYIADINPDGTFKSLHGQPEVEGNLYQLCVQENNPDRFWQYIECQNQNYQDLSSSFESCANQVGVDFDKIKSCAEGEQGAELLTTSLGRAKEVQASGSPTFYLAGELYSGQRTKTGLQRAMCAAIDDQAKACDDLPQDKEFKAYLIADSRCTKPECATDRLMSQLKTSFLKIEIEELDYISDKGKEYYDKYELIYLPAILIEKDVEQTENYTQIERYLTPVDDLYSLAVGAIHDPNMEICDNDQDDTGNDLVDCDDSDCDGFLECRNEQVQRLDLFVMSMCPYGTQAMNAMDEVLDNFGNNIDFHLNFIASENPDGTFTALHGQPEVDENIRELCAMEHYPNSYMDYVWCRNKNIQGDWTACAASYPAIKSCFEGSEGARLHSQNITLANQLGISASPTWLVNNRYKFSGINAETTRANFCQYNDVAGCENTLAGQTPTASGGSSAGSCN